MSINDESAASGRFGDFIRQLRTAEGLTMAQASERTERLTGGDYVKIDTQTWGNIERRARTEFLKPATLRTLAAVLHVQPYTLLGAAGAELGIDPAPATMAGLMPEKWAKLSVDDQNLIRKLIQRIPAGE
jgi:transcriptional regulator with XRE-family HTH domain